MFPPIPVRTVQTSDSHGGKRFHSYFWTRAVADAAVAADIHVSEAAASNAGYASPLVSPVTTPAAAYVNGTKLHDLGGTVQLDAGFNPLLLRFDTHGEAHFVLRKQSVPVAERQPLAMRWYHDPGVVRFDPISPASVPSAEWFRFRTAPGTTAITIPIAHSSGPVQAWYDGEPMIHQGYNRFEARTPIAETAVIALRLVPPAGFHGGATIPEPVKVATSGDGVMPLGDWSKFGILLNYSGGVRYCTEFTLKEQEAADLVVLDLGRVTATAEVWINGKRAGVRVAPPWKLDVSSLLQPGANQLEVLVFNTLANHYQTIPCLYRGDPASGLFGPVTLHQVD